MLHSPGEAGGLGPQGDPTLSRPLSAAGLMQTGELQQVLHVTAPAVRHSPLLAGDDPNLLTLAVGRDKPRLPPLIVRGIDDMQDVPIGEAEPLAGQATVSSPIVVKQGSVEEQREERCFS